MPAFLCAVCARGTSCCSSAFLSPIFCSVNLGTLPGQRFALNAKFVKPRSRTYQSCLAPLASNVKKNIQSDFFARLFKAGKEVHFPVGPAIPSSKTYGNALSEHGGAQTKNKRSKGRCPARVYMRRKVKKKPMLRSPTCLKFKSLSSSPKCFVLRTLKKNKGKIKIKKIIGKLAVTVRNVVSGAITRKPRPRTAAARRRSLRCPPASIPLPRQPKAGKISHGGNRSFSPFS